MPPHILTVFNQLFDETQTPCTISARLAIRRQQPPSGLPSSISMR
jgi:hypothetical protein